MDRKNNIICIMLNKHYDCMSYSFLEYCGMVENNNVLILYILFVSPQYLFLLLRA